MVRALHEIMNLFWEGGRGVLTAEVEGEALKRRVVRVANDWRVPTGERWSDRVQRPGKPGANLRTCIYAINLPSVAE